MIKKIFLIICMIGIFLNCIAFTMSPDPVVKEIPGIGTSYRYPMGENVWVETNFNLELLYIAAATGGAFMHEAYEGRGAFKELIESHYEKYLTNRTAKSFYKISLNDSSSDSNRFSYFTVMECVSFEEMLSDQPIQGIRIEYADFYRSFKSLKKFYNETDSGSFFQKALPNYNQMVLDFTKEFSLSHVERLKNFFGMEMKNQHFLIILTPMLNGGEAFEYNNQDKTVTYVNVMNPYCDKAFTYDLLYHETAHNFLSPIIEDNIIAIFDYADYQKLLAGPDEGCPTFCSSVNETLARAITICMLEQYHGKEMAYSNLRFEMKIGWRNLDEIYFLIKNKYLTDRNKYPDFNSFLPVILQYLKAKGLNQPYDIGPKEDIAAVKK